MSTSCAPWMQLLDGSQFFLLKPKVSKSQIGMIAKVLSRVPRFAGHSREFYCPTPDQRVLTLDLRWVPAGDLQLGDELVGFDEYPHTLGAAGKRRRRFKPSIVTAIGPTKKHVIRLALSDGSSITASAEHPWLVATKKSRNQKWMRTQDIACDVMAGQKRYMHKFASPWYCRNSYRAGWLAGMYDGEASFICRNRQSVLMFAQKPGPVLEQVLRLLRTYNFAATVYESKQSGVVNVQLRGGWRECMRFLGEMRPLRLLDKFVRANRESNFNKQMDGVRYPLEITGAYFEGEKECTGIETSTHTYICEGFAAHNSVAQHSVLVHDTIVRRFRDDYDFMASMTITERRQLRLSALLHDAHEAFVGDITSPMKAAIREHIGRDAAIRLDAMFRKIDIAIGREFGLQRTWATSDALKHADLVALATEKRDLMEKEPAPWMDLPEPDRFIIRPWTSEEAERRFLETFEALQ